jgi:hypothetical protein
MALVSISYTIIDANACVVLQVEHVSTIYENVTTVYAETLAHVTWALMALLSAIAIKSIRVSSAKHVSS